MIFLFDIDDTLYDLEHPFRVAFEARYGYLPEDIHELFLDFRKYNNEVYEDALKGIITMDDMVIYRARRAFYDHGIEIDDEEAFMFQMTYLEKKDCIRMDENIVKILKMLKENNIGMGIISNGPYEDQIKKLNYLGVEEYISYDNVFISGKEGYYKPQVEIFHRAVSHLVEYRLMSLYKKNSIQEKTNIKNITDKCKNSYRINNKHRKRLFVNKKFRVENEFNMRNIINKKWNFYRGFFSNDENKHSIMYVDNGVYYVGDSLENDILGGFNSGLRTIWLNRRNYDMGVNSSQIDRIATSYDQLYDIIKKIIEKVK